MPLFGNKKESKESAKKISEKLLECIQEDDAEGLISLLEKEGAKSWSADMKTWVFETTKHDTGYDEMPLIVYAAKKNHFDIVEPLVTHYQCNVNAASRDNCNAVYFSCENNNMEMLRFLLKNNGDPNMVPTDRRGVTSLMKASLHGNLEMMQVLINLDKTYPISFDWDKLVNKGKKDSGYTLFHRSCQNGYLEAIKWLLEAEQYFDVKIDKIKHTKTNSLNPLLVACNRNQMEVIDYLLRDVYSADVNDTGPPKTKLTYLDINDVNHRGRTALYMTSSHDNVGAMNIIFEKWGEQVKVNARDNDGFTPFHIACERNNYNAIHLLMSHRLSKDVVLVNEKDDYDRTGLMCAAANGNEQAIALLSTYPSIQIRGIKSRGKDAIEQAVYGGHIAIVCRLILSWMKRNDINNLDKLKESQVLSEPIINLWLGWAQERKNFGMYSFLTKFNENAIKSDNFDLIESFLLAASSGMEMPAVGQNEDNGNDDSIANNFRDMRKDKFIAKYLFDNLKTESLTDIFKVVTDGMCKFQCSFNDMLLFLCKMINTKDFNAKLQTTTKNSLNSDLKTEKSHAFFKNNLLYSNIWAATLTDDSDVTEIKQDEDVAVSSGGNGTGTGRDETILFDEISETVVKQELDKHKKILKEEMVKIQTEYTKQFKDLQTHITQFTLANREGISQAKLVSRFDGKMDHMVKIGVKPKYLSKDMPFDNTVGFNGKEEYDYNGYLTSVLIAAHNIDPIFQKECKEYFKGLETKHGIESRYAGAPVKTRSRSILKAKLDYKQRNWPFTQNIIDVVRCSVCFNDIKSFLDAFQRFSTKFVYRDIPNQKGCIKGIVRVKNDFTDFSDNLKNMELGHFNYADIKCNLLLEYQGQRIVGEIQFLLKFMLKFKKKQHNVYAFVRNEVLYDKLSKLNRTITLNKGDILYENLRKSILFRKVGDFSLFFEHLTTDEKFFVLKNKSRIQHLLKQNNWKKGNKLFDVVLKDIEG